MRLAKRLAFLCFDNSSGIIKGEQPLIRASRASKVAGAFLALFWHAKENLAPRNRALTPRRQRNTQLRHIRGRHARDASRLPQILRADAGQLFTSFQRQAG